MGLYTFFSRVLFSIVIKVYLFSFFFFPLLGVQKKSIWKIIYKILLSQIPISFYFFLSCFSFFAFPFFPLLGVI